MRTAVLALFFILPFVFSCRDNQAPGPAEMYYGEDVCERCKMIISEEPYAAQYTLPGGASKKFDDLGCMIHYTSEGEGGNKERDSITGYYVKDYLSSEWLDGRSAYYIWSGNIKTPMGHGIVALKDEQAARELAARENGQFLGGLKEASESVHTGTGR